MANNTFMTQDPQHSQPSLPELPAHLQSDTNITAHLASRFHLNSPTAKLSTQAIISINTYSGTTKGPDGTKEGSAMAACEDLASRAWTRLGHRRENEALLFLGESGSGKTTLRSHFVSSIIALSSTPLSTKLSYAAFVFDTLTTTKSVTSPSASKAGLFLELQYDTSTSTHPTLVGGKLLDHRLERSRIAHVPTGERSFHALYYLLAGTSPSERQHLSLEGGYDSAPGNRNSLTHGQKRWRYLGHPTQLKVGVNDTEGFSQFKAALRKLEFPRSEIADICRILACILHIGQLEFHTTQATTPAPDESGGYSHEGGEQVTSVRNREVLSIIATFLGVNAQDLEASLGHKTKTLHRERVTVMLDPRGARHNADELATTLYSLLVAFIIERINRKVCATEEAFNNTLSIVDFPGFAQMAATGCALDQLLNNAATEALYNVSLQNFFERKADFLETEEISVPPTSYFDNSDAVKAILKPGNGLLSILDDQMRRGKTDVQFLEALRKRFMNKNPAITVGEATTYLHGSNFATHNSAASFTVRHYAGEVEYPIEGILEENGDNVSGDMLHLVNSTRSDFVRELLGQEALQTVYHPKEKTAIVQASLSSKPSRKPSVARRTGDRPNRAGTRRLNAGDFDEVDSDPKAQNRKSQAEPNKLQGAAAEFLSSIENITGSISAPNTNAYFVYCIKPNDRRIANQFDSKCVRAQIQTLGIAEISQRLRNADFTIFLPFNEFLGLSEAENLFVGSDREKSEVILDEMHWPANEAKVGATGVLLSERCWAKLAKISNQDIPTTRPIETEIDNGNDSPNKLGYSESRVRLLGDPSPGDIYDDKTGAYFGSREVDAKSDAGASAYTQGDLFRNLETREQMAEKIAEKPLEEIDDRPTSRSRKRWLFVVWLLTWYVPDIFVKWFGGIKRKDVRTAWREKLAINILIWLSCSFVIFFIVVFPQLICPRQLVFSESELSSYNGQGASAYVAIRGIVFDLGAFIPAHQPSIIPDTALEKYAGKDATNLFPIQISALCEGVDGFIDPRVQLSFQGTNYTGQNIVTSALDPNARYHDFRASTNDSRPTWFLEQMLFLEANYFKGHVGWSPSYITELAGKGTSMAYFHGRVYDLSSYVNGPYPLLLPDDQKKISGPVPNREFMDSSVVNLFTQHPGTDVSQDWDALVLAPGMKANMQLCLDNLFYIGDLDTRNSTQCLFARYILLAISILLVSVIGFKFFAALQFGKKNMPENLDKFVMCTVPVYTEDEDSLRRAIDSAARMRYDDKRKLLVIICDGMIIGQGNDRPTPRIVLDILGVPDTVDPEPLSFESLGEGMRQHNLGKVYSGLYEVQGHIVPFLVIVKIGKPSEVSRPGNRGKRDSQMIIMRFLNRVHYNLPMTPLELEMHHQIRNIIGVNPTFYEFLLQIDADTVVAPDSATRMIAAFLHDTRLIGVCGETALTNAKSSMVTMMQVYEYYISHNLTKAFESLFGSVTCLPGCFSMYRIRAAETGKPLFVSREVVDAYSEIRVDTLHMKNLLHLGEDRYLTTLLLKFHSKYKTKFIFRAHAWTIAPDSWQVFMSQRRRWINSTVHNLIELIPLQQLCGFCCFSMRFVVFLDLLSTIVQPVIVGYIIYLIILLAENTSVVPITAFILLGSIYGLQGIIFILRRKWEMIGWMIIYVLAMPVFSFGLPLYAFWHMDDFSWGNTRVVMGEKGRQIIVSDEGKFDPATIPRKRWEQYQAELWEAQTQRDDHSEASGISYATKHTYNMTPSDAGGGAIPAMPMGYQYTYPPSRPLSRGMEAPPPRYGSATPVMGMGMGMGLSHAASFANTGGVGGMDAGAGMVEMSELGPGPLPSDDALLAEIRDILRTADLMTVTKKTVKVELERRFGVNLDAKKMYISASTEAVLSGQL